MTNEKVPERIWFCTERQVSVPHCFDVECDVEFVRSDLLATARGEIRTAALLQASKDVCMYCDGRAPGYEAATGPNNAGNYTHEAKNKAQLVATGAKGIVLCAASTIHARIKLEAALTEK